MSLKLVVLVISLNLFGFAAEARNNAQMAGFSEIRLIKNFARLMRRKVSQP